MVGPVLNGMAKRAATGLARDWLRRVGLAGFEDRYPHQLSGGMRKRVAMAAALINEPTILLMDEPFGALDVQTKAIMQTELLGLWEQLRPSVLFITHDLDEAVALADRVLIMTSSPGSIKQSFDIDLPRPRGEVQADPPRTQISGTAESDLGFPQGRGRKRLRTNGRRGMSTATATPSMSALSDDMPGRLQYEARRARRRHTALVWIGRVIVPILVLGGWQLFTSLGIVDKFFFGQPSGVWHSLVTLFTKGTAFGSIWQNLWVTIKEAIYGFLLGTGAGILLGLLLGQNRFLADVAGPYIKVVNSIPRIILGSIFIVAFGLGTFPKVLLAAVLVFFIVFFNAFQGVREVDQNLIANVKVLGASPLQVARHVTIPSALTLDHREPAHRLRLRHHRRPRC